MVYSPWGCKESDMTEHMCACMHTHTHTHTHTYTRTHYLLLLYVTVKGCDGSWVPDVLPLSNQATAVSFPFDKQD